MRKIFVKVKTQAKKTEVIDLGENHYEVSVKLPPIDGKANLAIIDALHDYLGVPKSSFTLIRGEKSKQKTFHVDM